MDAVLVRFPHVDPLLIKCGDAQVYAMLSTYTVGEARSIVRQARRPNGYEAFRLLNVRFNPSTMWRQRADLMKITNPQAGISLEKLAAEVVSWENLIVQYESRPGAERVSDAMRMAALVRMAPQALKQHLHMSAARYTTYMELREEIMSYIEQVTPAAHTTMDVGSVGVVKGGGCFICGGPHLQRDCKKSKGKGKDGSKGKAAGGKDGFKGKGKSHEKGGKGAVKGSGKKGGGKEGTCYNCGKPGHTRDQCWSRVKALNALESQETDPLMSQLQSSFAKAAAEEYARRRGESSSPLLPQQQQSGFPSSPVRSSAPSSTMPPASMGSLVVKQLCAMSWNRSRQQQQEEEEASSSHTSEVRRMRWPTVPIGSDRGMEMCKIVQITVDSGAAASVAPPDIFEHEEQLAPDNGLSFLSANGQVVPELYRVKPIVMGLSFRWRTCIRS